MSKPSSFAFEKLIGMAKTFSNSWAVSTLRPRGRVSTYLGHLVERGSGGYYPFEGTYRLKLWSSFRRALGNWMLEVSPGTESNPRRPSRHDAQSRLAGSFPWFCQLFDLDTELVLFLGSLLYPWPRHSSWGISAFLHNFSAEFCQFRTGQRLWAPLTIYIWWAYIPICLDHTYDVAGRWIVILFTSICSLMIFCRKIDSPKPPIIRML